MDNYNSNEFRCKYTLRDAPILNAEALLDNIGIPDNVNLIPRHMFMKIGITNKARGSAYMEYGNTKVMVHFDNPKEVVIPNGVSEVMGSIKCSVKYSPLIYDDADVILKKEECMNFALRETLESVVCLQQLINLQLEISVVVLDDDGCALSTAINCCGIALISGGIPLYDLLVSSTICYLNETEYINPTADIEDAVAFTPKMEYDDAEDDDYSNEYGTITMSNIFTYNQITHYSQQGYMSANTFERLCNYAINVNRRLLCILRQLISNRVDLELAFERYGYENCVDEIGNSRFFI